MVLDFKKRFGLKIACANRKGGDWVGGGSE